MRPDRRLADGDEVTLIPPVSGGPGARDRPSCSRSATSRCRWMMRARVVAPDRGGITLFAGTVRGVTRPARRIATDYLEYEAYPEMAEAVLAQIGAEAQARWPSVSAVGIVHRVGRLAVGDLRRHRGGRRAPADTFDACHYAIDRVKQIAPIWKKEVGPDGTFWVEGPERR